MSTRPGDGPDGGRPRVKGERIGHGAFIATVAFLAFVGGAMAVLSKTYPYEPLRNSYRAGVALVEKYRVASNRFATDLWSEARTGARGVTVNEPGLAYEGYTLYTSGDGAYARLMAMDGRTAHEWRLPYSKVWTKEAAVKKPQPDELVYMRKAHVFPNGDLLAIYVAANDTPWGYGMVKLDKDSRVIWRYLEHTHHDFDVAPDGRIFALTHAFTSEQIEGFENLDRPRLDDFLVILSPDGRELRKISLTKALARSRYSAYLHTAPHFSLVDPLHTNTVEYLSAPKAKALAIGQPGQVLLSFRDIGVIAILDAESETLVWAARGPWLGQHDPSVLANGRLLVFDNMGRFEAGNGSRVIEIDPHTMGIEWEYAGREGCFFDSPIRGSAERLPNGNTLITESSGGRLFEVTRGGRIAWEFVNPVREKDGRYIPIVSWGQRIAADFFRPDFLGSLTTKTEVSHEEGTAQPGRAADACGERNPSACLCRAWSGA